MKLYYFLDIVLIVIKSERIGGMFFEVVLKRGFF